MDDATKVALGARRRDRPHRQDARRVRRDRHRPVPRHAGARRGDPAAVADGGAGSLSEGVQRLADRGQAATVEIEGARWLDVDDAVALAKAEAMVAAAG